MATWLRAAGGPARPLAHNAHPGISAVANSMARRRPSVALIGNPLDPSQSERIFARV